MDNENEDDDIFFEDLMDPSSKEVVKVEEVIEERNLEEDFKRAKHHLERIAAVTTAATEDAAEMAKQMAEPRGYDALSKIANAAATANKAVVELYKNKTEGKGADDGKIASTTTTNNLFLTTAEMAEKLKELAAESG